MSKVISFKSYCFETHRHTHPIDCSTWTTKVIDDKHYKIPDSAHASLQFYAGRNTQCTVNRTVEWSSSSFVIVASSAPFHRPYARWTWLRWSSSPWISSSTCCEREPLGADSTAWMPFLSSNHRCQSTDGNSKHTLLLEDVTRKYHVMAEHRCGKKRCAVLSNSEADV